MGGPNGTRAKRFDSGTPCKCTTLAWTAANACPMQDSYQLYSSHQLSSTAAISCAALSLCVESLETLMQHLL